MNKLIRRYKLFKKLKKLGYITEEESNSFETSVLDNVQKTMEERIAENETQLQEKIYNKFKEQLTSL